MRTSWHRRRWARQAEWAKRNMPEEHHDFVVSAIQMLRYADVEPTRESITSYLRQQGTHSTQLFPERYSEERAA